MWFLVSVALSTACDAAVHSVSFNARTQSAQLVSICAKQSMNHLMSYRMSQLNQQVAARPKITLTIFRMLCRRKTTISGHVQEQSTAGG